MRGWDIRASEILVDREEDGSDDTADEAEEDGWDAIRIGGPPKLLPF